MITIIWRGYVQSENERHAMRWVTRTAEDGSRVKAPVIAPKREYQAFVDDLSTAIMAEARHQVGVRRFGAMSVVVQCSIGPLLDGQNLLKPICDAIQRSKILTNDRNLRHRLMLPDERHAKGEVDTILLNLYELEEVPR